MTMLPPDPLFVIRTDEAITCLSFSSKQDCIISGNIKGTVHLWSLGTYRKKDEFSASSESLLQLYTTVEPEDCILVQDKLGSIALWTSKEGAWSQLWSVKVDFMGFCQLCVEDDVIITALSSAGLQFISLAHGELKNTLSLWGKKTSGELTAIKSYSKSTEKFILVANERGDIALWDWTGSACGSSIHLEECALTLVFDSQRMRGAAAGPGGAVTCFKVSETGLSVSRTIRLPFNGVSLLSLRPDYKLMAAACWNGKLRLISWKSLVSLAGLNVHDHSLQALAFTSKSPYLMAGGCKDGYISIWDLYNSR